jgi:hypothetical protein
MTRLHTTTFDDSIFQFLRQALHMIIQEVYIW